MNEVPEEQLIGLIDESGEERSYRLHDAFDFEGSAYYLVEAADDPDEVLLLREVKDGLVAISGDEFDRVIAMLDAEEGSGAVSQDLEEDGRSGA
jgi:hypothetical protein